LTDNRCIGVCLIAPDVAVTTMRVDQVEKIAPFELPLDGAAKFDGDAP
jgi:hypothetical protein